MNTDPREGIPSASSFHRLVECPGSFRLEQSIAASEIASDPQAERGTRIHAAFCSGDHSALNEEELEAYQQGEKHLQLMLEAWQKEYNLDTVKEATREQRLWLHGPSLEPIASGQLDRLFLAEGHAFCPDLKSGWATHVPAATANYQLRIYALLVWQEFGISNIRVGIIRAKSKADPHDYCDYDSTALEYSLQSVQYHLFEAGQENAPKRAGSHCDYCKGKARCEVAATYAMLPSVMAQRALPESQRVEDMVAALGHADLKKIWDASTTINKIIDAVDSRLKGLSKEELDALGLELPEHGRKLNTIVAPDGAWEHLKTVHGFEDGELWSVLDMSRGALAKLVAAKQGIAQAKAMAWVDEVLKPYIQFGYARPSLREKKTE